VSGRGEYSIQTHWHTYVLVLKHWYTYVLVLIVLKYSACCTFSSSSPTWICVPPTMSIQICCSTCCSMFYCNSRRGYVHPRPYMHISEDAIYIYIYIYIIYTYIHTYIYTSICNRYVCMYVCIYNFCSFCTCCSAWCSVLAY
jgi:hypothetical protein